MGLLPGTEVVSKRFGPAIIREVSPNGVQIYSKKLGTSVRVPADDIEPIAPTSVTLTGRVSPDSVAERTAASNVRAALEALRFGIVPLGQIRRVTVGFDVLEQWVSSRLPHSVSGRRSFSEVCAPFGCGKSHNIEAIRTVALEQGYVVAHAEVNGQDLTLSDPAKLICSLWSSLQLPKVDAFHPNWEIHVRALQRSASALLAKTEAFERVHANTRTVEVLKRCSLLDEHEESLEGLLSGNIDFSPSYLRPVFVRDVTDRDDRRNVNPRSLIRHSVDDRATDFANALVAYAAICESAGFKGLVVTIDEFETEYVGWSRAREARIASVVEAISVALNSQNRAFQAPLAIFVASVGQEGVDEDRMLSVAAGSDCGESRSLPPWTESSLLELAKNLHELYCEAYSVDEAFSRKDVLALVSRLKSDDGAVQVRRFIRNYIALQDSRYGPPRR